MNLDFKPKNTELKPKYNDFISILEQQNKNNSISNSIQKQESICICDQTSSDSNLFNNNSDKDVENDSESLSTTNLKKSDNLIKTKDEQILTNSKDENKKDDLNNLKEDSDSLIDIEYNKNQIWIEKPRDNESINSEFNEIINRNRAYDLDTKEERLKKLDKIYEKKLIKNLSKDKPTNKKNEKNIIVDEEIDLDVEKLIKNYILLMEENLFLECTKGYNVNQDLYKFNLDKLKSKLGSFKLDADNNLKKFKKFEYGFMYRNFSNPKVFTVNDISYYWNRVTKTDNVVTENEIASDDKFLLSCLKNFVNSNKFKKKIGSSIYKTFKKTVQLNSNLIIDVIFFIKYKL